jgi:protein-tyrosine phosphatase
MTMRLLMVCLGNVCRSPTAEAAVRAVITARGMNATVESCGTAAYHEGKGADPRTIAHAARRGLDLRRHRARQLRPGDFAAFDSIYAMDEANLADLTRQCPPEHLQKVALFLGDAEVPDPWSGGPADFERVLDLCQGRADQLLTTALGTPGP